MGNTFKLGTAPQVTTNYIPKSNSNSFSNSLIFDNGTAIAIGNGLSSATPQLGLIEATDGSGTNIAGAELRLQGGQGTGTGAGGALTFYTSAAGSSGSSTNSALERMRITSSGNVGIGTSSPGDRLTIATGASTSAAVTFWANAGTSANELYVGQGSSNEAYVFNRANQHLVLGTNNTERMRITSTGNVGIGTSSPGQALDIVRSAGTSCYVGTSTGSNYLLVGTDSSGLPRMFTGNNDMTFWTNSIERLRITSGGTAWFKGGNSGDVNTTALRVDNNKFLSFFNAANTGWAFSLASDTSDNGILGANASLIFCTSSSFSEKWRITSGGILASNGNSTEASGGPDKFSIGYSNGNYGWLQSWGGTNIYINRLGNAVYAGTQRIDNNSDQRLKENITSVENALDIVLKLQGRKFNMIDENGKLRYGFVAQEVQPHLSDFVTESVRSYEKDDIKIENLLTLESSGAAWAAILIEAIKELSAKVSALENKS